MIWSGLGDEAQNEPRNAQSHAPRQGSTVQVELKM